MSRIAQKEFIDEYDRAFNIKKFLKKKRYKDAMNCLIHCFDEKKYKGITAKQLRELLCIVDRITSYEILDSLVILGVLEKKKETGKVYYAKNKEWWGFSVRELKKNGG